MANPLYDALFGCHAGQQTPFLLLEDGRVISHAEFVTLAARFACEIAGLGLKPGDRLAAQVEKSPEALAVYAACVQAGVVFLPLNPGYTAAEVGYFVEDSGAKLFLCDPAKEAALAPVVAGALTRTLGAAGEGSFAEAAAARPAQFATVARAEDDLAALLYTSGTTGRSKGAMLSQGNLLSNARVLTELWQFTAVDVLLHALPIFHTHGLFVATNVMLLAGGAMIFLPRFEAEAVIRQLPHATAMMGVPTFYTRLLAEQHFTGDLTRHMRLFISGSAPLLAETHLAFEDRTGHRILERYGMTETNMNCSNPFAGERKPGTVGPPLPGVELRIVGPDGSPVAEGEIGMIEVRGPNVFLGYWRMPQKTAEELRADGFFSTGDLGSMDADGYVQIVGRQKDVIISGGYNIYPKEIELLLDAAPGVGESAVIGVPHADLGEVPVAVVTAQKGRAPELEALGVVLAASLARFKQPRAILIVEALPRNTMGKVQKNLLRDKFRGLFTDPDFSG